MSSFDFLFGPSKNTQNAVMNAKARSGTFPLVVFSHGYGGERRQSTFFYTHLASHGYVIAAMDHVGNTAIELLTGQAAGDAESINRFMQSRPVDASFVIDQMLAGASGLDIDEDRIGMSGHSFGGWTTLKTVEKDLRIKAIMPLAPGGGGEVNDKNPMASSLSFNLHRPIPCLYIVSELDSIVPIAGIQDLYQRNPEPALAVVLMNADHFHFNDHVEAAQDGYKAFIEAANANADEETRRATNAILSVTKPSTELVPGSHAHTLINGLGVAHFDAHLNDHGGAADILQGDLPALLANQGISISMLS
jgi:dienelactone hydrolase